jgi:polygalacturonase
MSLDLQQIAQSIQNLGISSSGFIQNGAGAVARTVQSKLTDTINVLDFGAVGDGVTNNTTAFTLAIAAASAANTALYVPTGVFKVAQ